MVYSIRETHCQKTESHVNVHRDLVGGLIES
jgi:hypothetical protein